MPNMTSILLKRDDGLDITLFPVSDTPPTWRSNISGISNGGQVLLKAQYEELKNGRMKVNVKLDVPIMEVIPTGSVAASGFQAAPTVADVESISVTFYLSKRGSNETRADLYRMFAHLLIGAGSTSGQYIFPGNGLADTYRDIASGYVAPYSIVNLVLPQ